MLDVVSSFFKLCLSCSVIKEEGPDNDQSSDRINEEADAVCVYRHYLDSVCVLR